MKEPYTPFWLLEREKSYNRDCRLLQILCMSMNKVLTLYSPEKEIGKTTIGINLGVSLINETQKSAIFVDFDAHGEGVPAWSMLRLPSSNVLPVQELTGASVRKHLQTHSSRLSVLTVDAVNLQSERSSRDFVKTLLTILVKSFDYVIIDISTRMDAMTHEIFDETDVFIVMTSSLECEQPIGIIGHHNFRLIVNRRGTTKEASVQRRPQQYILPNDSATLDAFRTSGVPFVIQTPYRQLSQIVGRLARDVGGKQFGIALTGGAALGLTQIGVLDVLERGRITIDMMTGASFGALVGAAHAAGRDVRKITQLVLEWAQSCHIVSRWSWRRFFTEQFFRDTGLHDLCYALLADVYFDELSIPLNVVAIDARTGASVVFKEGKVLDAIKASMRIPGLFVPFKQTESYLIDGSVIYPMPVSPLKQMGADITTAVIVTPTPAESQGYFRQRIKGRMTGEQRAMQQNYALVAATFDGLMNRLMESAEHHADDFERVAPDILILPEVRDISWRDFQRAPELIERGTQAAEMVISHIEKLKWG